MISREISGLEQVVNIEKLDNGLTVYLVPFKNRKNYYIEYVTKFGASIHKFKSVENDRVITVPYGIAHFLEHKMFEQESGEDPFQFFSKYGSDANASTGYKTTSYTVEGTNHIEENLDYLLTYVNSPYFTEENVEKEKNIIIEEINMYNDEPEGKLYRESSKAIFKNHPMRVDIGGTEKSVRTITSNDLYSCYNTFYQPSNMMLFIGGDFDSEKVMSVIKKNQALMSHQYNHKIMVKKVNEPKDVNIKFKELNIEGMIIPKFIFTIKLSLKNIPVKQRYRYALAITLLYSILYGSSSSFREEVLNLGIMSFFATSKVIVDDFLLIEFIAESRNPKALIDKIVEYFKNKEITEIDVERHKKSYIASQVLNSDQVVPTVSNLVDNVIDYGDIIYDKIDIVRSITLKDVLSVKDTIDIENSSIVIAYPKE